jgi:hypothetical protein
MRKKIMMKASVVFMLCLLCAVQAYAEVATSAGINFRLRQETWDNLNDFRSTDGNAANGAQISNDTNFWRLRTQLWSQLDVNKQYTGYVRLANEARYYMDTTSTSNKLGFNKDELLFDNLYVKANRPLELPFVITYGRQDLLGDFGEGFLIVDGTPGDGSRTYYFDAARVLTILNEKWNVDMVYVSNHNQEDRLPMAYSAPKRTLDGEDNDGLIVYGRGKIGENLVLEPYYIWKKESIIKTPNSAVPFSSIPDLRLNTYGAHAVYIFGSGWKLHAELAVQDGSYDNGNKREGLGWYAFIGRSYDNVSFKPSFDLGYVYLSGDDPSTTTKNEAWDPLWSRYPWYSELYSLSLATESPDRLPAYWSNLKMYRFATTFALPNDSGLQLSYALLLANENTISSVPASSIFSADGKTRGQLVVAKLTHRFSKTVDGYVTVEDFVPGNYYKPTNQDNATFVRWELQWKI